MSDDDREPLNTRPLKTAAMHGDEREHAVAKIEANFPPPVIGRPSATERATLLRASFGLTFVGLTQMQLHRAIREGRGKGRPRETLLREIEARVLDHVAGPWAIATVKDAAEQSVGELSPCTSFKAFKDAYRDKGRHRPANDEDREADAAWVAEQQRILRLLGIAGLQDQSITSEHYKLGDEVRSHERPWWQGKESRMEGRLLLDAKRQESWHLSLPEMIEVAIHGHVHPADLWRTYTLSSQMFDAALCAGWCGIGKLGPLSLDGARWLAHYLAGRTTLDSNDAAEIGDYLRSRDLILRAFNRYAGTDLGLLRLNLLNEVMAGIVQGQPILIRTPFEMAKVRLG
ncbi:hypothetical protein SAMN02799622_02795 [Methylobacterium sp. UNC378MF]|uniref:hypothetical protein n=1 Tax=Methylobacterium sp. UNC378MF TaxID=1502748 RepID=UPI00088D41A5|nr:hypothetical protein [Methylobacterium sp. UNC378MF]SDA21630.1 hypothetical protein SAMN02799622_02795 [Methylobacterium sp. UNC378MF]